MALGEDWYDTDAEVNVRVIPIHGWQRDMKWNDTQLEWVPPSPNLPTFEHAYAYVGTCFLRYHSIRRERHRYPFLMIGEKVAVSMMIFRYGITMMYVYKLYNLRLSLCLEKPYLQRRRSSFNWGQVGKCTG